MYSILENIYENKGIWPVRNEVSEKFCTVYEMRSYANAYLRKMSLVKPSFKQFENTYHSMEIHVISICKLFYCKGSVLHSVIGFGHQATC